MTPAQLLERASKAKSILDAHLYQESWEMVRNAIIAQIEACPLNEVGKAEDLRKCLRLLRDVRANLELCMNQGKIVQFTLQEEMKRREEPKRGIIKGFFR